MDDHNLASVRSRLLKDLAALDAEDERGRDGRGTVTLDQQSVGRLSRMDALQQQAMAQATQRRRDGQRRRIEAALARIEDGEFGYCTECGEDIDPDRLAFDPSVALCRSCMRG